MKLNIFALALLVWPCFAVPSKTPGGRETTNGQVPKDSTGTQSEIILDTEGEGEALLTNELPPPNEIERQPSYIIHGGGPFQKPSPGKLKLHVPSKQTIMVPQVTMSDFGFFDQDGNGVIDSTELAIGSNLPGFADHAFRISDVDNDGFVNPDEFFRFPMTWQRVVAEVRFMQAAQGGSTQGLSGTEDTPALEGEGETTSYDGQTGVDQENNATMGVTEDVGNTSAPTAVTDMAVEEGEEEQKAENEGQFLNTTGSVGEVTTVADQENAESEGSSITTHASAGGPEIINNQTSPESETAGENQEVEMGEEVTGEQKPSAGSGDTRRAHPTYGNANAAYSASQTGRYQERRGPVSRPSDGDGGEGEGQERAQVYGGRPTHASDYYKSQQKASYYPVYPVKSKYGSVQQYVPYIQDAKHHAIGRFTYFSQSRRNGDSSEEERGGGSSSDEDDDDRRR